MIAIIPARGGSKGVPKKNIKNLNGIPLIGFSIKACLACPEITRVIVSTDCEEIAKVSKALGAEVPFLRPAEFATDTSSDLCVMEHYLSWAKENEGQVPESFLHIRATSPLRDPAKLTEAIKIFESKKEGITALRSAHEMSESAYKMMEIEDEFLTSIFTKERDVESLNRPRQGYPKTYVPNGYVDILKSSTLLELNKIHGNKVLAYISPVVHEVDTIEDFDYIQWSMEKLDPEIKKIYQ
jgi:CMP-N-acetylneuraminic acid synthetase